MNFFDHQDAAHRRTVMLVVLFTLAVVGTIVAIYLAVRLGTVFLEEPSRPAHGEAPYQQQPRPFFEVELFLWVMLITLAIISLGTWYKISELAAGGHVIAKALGGKLLRPDTKDIDEKRLLNVVEEMSIASGMTVPKVYLLEKEPGINAFAAGYTPDTAAIGVTAGALKHLTREELEGVIAHEYAHILSGDMRTNVRLIGILHGILVIGLIGYMLLRVAFYGGGGRDGRAALAMFVIGLLAVIIGFIGVFFGNIIKAAISRQREFHADATAIRLTRNPNGLAGALKKIGGVRHGGRIRSPHAELASHMYFAPGISQAASLFSTHPPLAERIRRLSAGVEGQAAAEPVSRRAASQADGGAKPQAGSQGGAALQGLGGGQAVAPLAAAAVIGGAAASGGGAATTGGATAGTAGETSWRRRMEHQGTDKVRMQPEKLTEQVGLPGAEHVAFAHDLIESLSERLSAALHNPHEAPAVVFAMLLSDDAEVRGKQLEQLPTQQINLRALTEELAPEIDELGAAARLPLLDLSITALREMSAAEHDAFRNLLSSLISAKKQVPIFAYVLVQVLNRHLSAHYRGRSQQRTRYRSLTAIANCVADLIAAVARATHDDPQEAAEAYQAAMESLNLQQHSMPETDAAEHVVIHEALKRISAATPRIKERLVRALAVCAQHDGYVTVEQSEVIRAVADALDCPMPPLLASAPE